MKQNLLIIQDKLVEASYIKSITTNQYQADLWHKTIKKTGQSTAQFSFIDLSQWVLLILLNFVCFSFIVLAYNLIN